MPETTDRPSPLELAVLSGIFILALALRLPLMTRGLYFDELQTVVHFVEAPSAWDTIARVYAFNNQPFYSLLARWSEAAFGRAEWALRLPALLCGMALLPLLWLGVRRRFGRIAALVATAALATSSVHIGFSVSARAYTGLALDSWLSCILFVGLVRDRRGSRWAVAYALVIALGLWNHLYLACVVAVQGLVLAILALPVLRESGWPGVWARFRRVLLGAAGGILLALICYGPAWPRLLPVLLESHRGAFVPELPLKVLSYLVGRGITPAATLLVAMLLAGIAVALQRLRESRAERLGLVLLFVIPLGAAWLARQDSHRDRFFVFLLPFVVLCLALTLEEICRQVNRVRGPAARLVGGFVAVALSVSMGWLWAGRPASNVPRGGFREAVISLEAPPSRPGARVASCAIGIGAPFYAWYARRPVLLPESVEEFTRLVAANDEVRCAWLDSFSDTPAWRAIGALLESQCGPAEPHHVLQTYRCRRETFRAP